ncbi:hypothetical protein HO133_009798 [Letharia lupina]|uniref:Zinc finger Mcm10/DnaG-type domain-containing protein n=1 Tax=Letharia lupina TaxID=560253 RepID=A0A8H6CME1_9LECA|nr:uncharacterized protein HO133_009798 [Letharia lupina]KAF6225796.1 hypothetical protein HO133_009798 [Letharia lupina]
MSTGAFDLRWPPRSPHEALLSSPTGRQKIRQYYDRTSPSPSPLKIPSTTTNLGPMRRKLTPPDSPGEDEETLQLKLAAIEAKLKLKRLQQKKNKAGVSSSNFDCENRGKDQSSRKENLPPPSQSRGTYGKVPLARPKSATDVQIPVSPQRKHVAAEEAHSPGRVLLGIDKGLKGKNISLRRPQGAQAKDEDPFRNTAPLSSVPRSVGLSRSSTVPQLDQSGRSKSFSEKIAETRQQDKARKEKADKLQRQKSLGFGVQQQDIDAFKTAADSTEQVTERRSKHDPQVASSGFSRDEVLKAVNKPNGGLNERSNTSAGVRRARAQGKSSNDIWINPNAQPEMLKPSYPASNDSRKRARSLSPKPKASDPPPREASPETSTSLFEPFASLHLSKRLLPHNFLTGTFSEKHIFLLPSLLSAVKSPDFLLPDVPEPDHVVLAIIASKSSPLIHKGAHKSTSAESTSIAEAANSEQNTNGKYMVLTLTDLKWTVDLFLFATGYTRFRKLTPGTVVALLNPEIMPPPPGKADTGRFSLKLASSDDTVLEIGTSRDLGWCKSVRKDGKQCGSWIDKRHTDFCEFHVDVVVERTRRGRMEVQGMSAPFAPGGRRGGRTGHFGDYRRGQKPARDDGLSREGPQYDRGSASRYFVAPSTPGFSAAQLLDADGGIERGGSKEERIRKRLAEREKENEIAKKLGEGGNGAGSEYLRLRTGGETSAKNADPQAADPIDATSLGLLGNKARNVHLSPIKKKRKVSALSVDGSRKKTRFVTDRGIKEAGRESFGGDVAMEDADDDDDDDGLEVV